MEKDLEKQLYNNYIKGNKECFEQLYNKYKKKIEYFIYNIVKDYQKAEDLTQETFIYVMKHKIKDDCSFRSTLYLIARSKAYNYIAVENRRSEINDIYLNPNSKLLEKDILEIIENEEVKKEIFEAIDTLDERYKNAIYLSKIENLSYEETAEILGESLQNTKNLIHRGTKQLRKILLKKGFDNMNRYSRIIIVVVLILLVLGPISVIAGKYLLEYTKDGKLVVYPNQEIPEEIEDGTPIVIAVPNTPKEDLDEFQRKEKEKFMQEHTDLQNEIVENNINEPICPGDEEPDFMDVLYKYYGEENIVELYLKMQEELEEVIDQEKPLMTGTQKEILEKAIFLIENDEPTEEEKNLLKDALLEILSEIYDEDMLNRVKEVIGDYTTPPNDNPTR